MRISDWSSDVCSSDLKGVDAAVAEQVDAHLPGLETRRDEQRVHHVLKQRFGLGIAQDRLRHRGAHRHGKHREQGQQDTENGRSEEHTSELQSLMRISYAVFCLKKKSKHTRQ